MLTKFYLKRESFCCHFICEETKKLSALNLKLNVTLLSYPLNISYFNNKTQ